MISNTPSRTLYCPVCNTDRVTYRAGEGDSAPTGSLCCSFCQRVLEPVEPAKKLETPKSADRVVQEEVRRKVD